MDTTRSTFELTQDLDNATGDIERAKEALRAAERRQREAQTLLAVRLGVKRAPYRSRPPRIGAMPADVARLIREMRTDPGKAWTASELADATGWATQYIGRALANKGLVDGQITRNADGGYLLMTP